MNWAAYKLLSETVDCPLLGGGDVTINVTVIGGGDVEAETEGGVKQPRRISRELTIWEFIARYLYEMIKPVKQGHEEL